MRQGRECHDQRGKPIRTRMKSGMISPGFQPSAITRLCDPAITRYKDLNIFKPLLLTSGMISPGFQPGFLFLLFQNSLFSKSSSR